MVKKVVLWILVIGCMTAIFMFSAQPAEESTNLSDSVLYKILEFFNVFDDMKRIGQVELIYNLSVLVRKLAHFSIDALLGFLSRLLFGIGYDFDGKNGFAAAFSLSVIYAVTDEIHQLFVPGRSGMFTDVLIDSLGAFVGVLIGWAVCSLLARRVKND